jgi:hypothetical protein
LRKIKYTMNENRALTEQRKQIHKVLKELALEQYKWGHRKGIFFSINKLTEEVENK